MAERKARKRRTEPTLADQIAESGETEKDARTVQLDEAREDLRFLGREFCAWLIYHRDSEDVGFGRGTGSFSIKPVGRITLLAYGEVAEVRISGPGAAASAEARFVLGRGAQARALELSVVKNERQWTAELEADTLDVSRGKLPAVLSEADDDQEDERLYLMDELDGIVREAFTEWLTLRVSPRWPKEVAAIGAWLGAGGRPADAP